MQFSEAFIKGSSATPSSMARLGGRLGKDARGRLGTRLYYEGRGCQLAENV